MTSKKFSVSELAEWFYKVDMTHRLIDHMLEMAEKYEFKSSTHRALLNSRYVLCVAYLDELFRVGPVAAPYKLDNELELRGSVDYYIDDRKLLEDTRRGITIVAGAYQEMFYKTKYPLDKDVVDEFAAKFIDPTNKVINDYIKSLPGEDDAVVYMLTYNNATSDFFLNGVKIRHIQLANDFEDPINAAFDKPGDIKIAKFDKKLDSTAFVKDFKKMPAELRSALFNTSKKATKMPINTKITNRLIREYKIKTIEVDQYLRSMNE